MCDVRGDENILKFQNKFHTQIKISNFDLHIREMRVIFFCVV